MGHDAVGFFERQKKVVIIDRFRRSAFDRYNKALYEVLGVEDFYGGYSGNEKQATFTRDDIEIALGRLDALREDKNYGFSFEEMEGLREKFIYMLEAGDPGARVVAYDVKTGEELEPENIVEMIKSSEDDNDIRECTCEDGLRTEYKFLSTLKRCMEVEDLDQVMVWFG